MATGITIKLLGAKELAEQLKKFPVAFRERAIAMGVKAGARILTTHMRRVAYSAPSKTKRKFTKTLRKAIKYAAGKPSNPIKGGKAWVGLKKIKGESRARNYYRVLETGRKPYKRIKTGHAYAGTPKAMRPFFQRAWDAKRGEVSQAIVNGTRIALAREAGRAYAKSKAGRR